MADQRPGASPTVDDLERMTGGDPGRVVDLVESLTEAHNAEHRRILDLNAAHSLLSPKVKAVMASDLMESSQAGGDASTESLDRAQALLSEMGKKLFDVPYVEYRPASGAQANGLFFLGAMKPGDPVMALSARNGGHYTYQEVSYPGSYGLNITEVPCDGEDYPTVNLEHLADEVRRVRPKWLTVGGATMLFPYQLREIAEMVRGVGGRVHYDGAHILGLAASGVFQDPLHEGASVMTGSTQKTLSGPLGGLVLMHDEDVAESLNSRIPNLIASFANNRTVALAVTMAEHLAFGDEYAAAVVANARALASALDSEGFTVPGKDRGFTRSHVVLVDLDPTPHGAGSVNVLRRAGIVSSLAALPRTYPEKRALRLGSPVCTKKGMGEAEMVEIARLVRRVLLEAEEPEAVGQDVAALVASFPDVRYCF
jgi:glycine hydroxymethyltransferase